MKKFKLITLLGIRPDYIRMHKLIKLLDNYNSGPEHVLVHSGQHYDPELYSLFLEELKIRKPDIDLGIGLELKKEGRVAYAYQLSLLSEKVFELLKKIKPNAVLILGDNNTVLSSIIIARCGVPVIHIEAGGRSFDWRMPEEKNRVIIDHLSDALYCYLERYKELLLVEGIEDFRIKVVGNIIVDALNDYKREIDESNILEKLKIREREFILLTLHREENVSDKNILENKLVDIVRFAEEKKLFIVFPIMPRTETALKNFGIEGILNSNYLIKIKPLGFFDFSKLEKTARLIVTDSGTVQEDGLIFGTPCVVARRSTERPETIWAGATILEGFEGKNTLYNKMKEAFNMKTDWDRTVLNPEGGSPSERIYNDLIGKIEDDYFKKSRSFETLKQNPFVRKTYNEE